MKSKEKNIILAIERDLTELIDALDEGRYFTYSQIKDRLTYTRGLVRWLTKEFSKPTMPSIDEIDARR